MTASCGWLLGCAGIFREVLSQPLPEALYHLLAYLTVALDDRRPCAWDWGFWKRGSWHHQGQDQAASERLADFSLRTQDPWFLTLCDYLRGQLTEAFE